VAALALLTFSRAGATPVTTGGSVSPAALSSLTGVTLLATTNGTFSTGLESGTYTAQVYKNNSTSDLDFVYDFTNSPGSSDGLNSATMSSFLGFTTDVYYLSGSGATPSSVTRDQAPVIKYYFSGLVSPGQSSDTLVIETNATGYGAGFLSLQDGGATTVAAYAPTGVPEPASMLLLGGGLLALGIARRRAAKA
jgi:hypothetical protein